MNINIVYEDEQIIVCEKPCGVPTQPDPTGAEDLYTHLTKEKGKVYLIHRLDRGVGGLMVFARTKEAAAHLSEQVADHGNFRKIYHAVLSGSCPENGDLVDFLYHDKRLHKAFVVKSKRAGVKEARLTYQQVTTGEVLGTTATLVRIELQTGRFHQIRVQFASRKTPLLGDGKYGSRVKCPLALWATGLSFLHPKTKERLSFTTQPPKEDIPWCAFASHFVS